MKKFRFIPKSEIRRGRKMMSLMITVIMAMASFLVGPNDYNPLFPVVCTRSYNIRINSFYFVLCVTLLKVLA